jgi:hypothetical protein
VSSVGISESFFDPSLILLACVRVELDTGRLQGGVLDLSIEIGGSGG